MEDLKVVDKRIEVLIVDDQPRARRSLRALLSTRQPVQGVEEAAGGLEAIQWIENAQPVLVVIDVRLRGIDGLETTRLIKARWPEIKIIVLSMYPDFAIDALAAGADAFVSKGEPPEKLLEILSAVISARKNEQAEQTETEDQAENQ
jgi:DNA-binding NarL/FixJ family response regulator